MQILIARKTRRSWFQRTFIPWAARIALLAYVLQLVAIDHWHESPAQALMDLSTAAHSVHCHGAAGGCADSSDVGNTISVVHAPLIPPPPVYAAVLPASSHWYNLVPQAPDEPPRLAA